MSYLVNNCIHILFLFFLSSRRRHTRSTRDWSSDVCSSDLTADSPGPSGGTSPRHDAAGDRRVIGVLSQHGLQLSASEDEHPVQNLTPNGADPSLRVGVSSWRPHRSAKHPEPFSGKDRIERSAELRIPIADQKPDAADAVCAARVNISEA